MTLLETRSQYNLSQGKAASIIGMPLRTYLRYEKDDNYGSELKRESMIRLLVNKCEITETKGLLTFEQIKESLTNLFNGEYKDKVEFCYLFGSYAKGYAKEDSDVDLFVKTSLTGLAFAGLSESIRLSLHKKVDLVRFSNIEGNLELLADILKNGIRIY